MEAKQFQEIHAAFVRGDLDALRAAVDDPALIPNGQMPISIGSCLVYAIYHSPLARTDANRGLPGVIPEGALLTAEITILESHG